jgi:hypothetical protein
MDRKSVTGDQSTEPNVIQPNTVVTSDEASVKDQVTATPIESKAPEPKPLPSAEGVSEPMVDEVSTDPQVDNVTWTASEFIAHYKSAGWYVLLVIVMFVVAVGVWFVTKDKFSTALVAVGVLLLGVYGAHKPRQLTYELDSLGLKIGNTHNTFSEFRSFSIVTVGAFSSIELVPLRRFAMYTTVYFDPADEDKIVKILGVHLPMEEPRNDPIDQLMHRLRF